MKVEMKKVAVGVAVAVGLVAASAQAATTQLSSLDGAGIFNFVGDIVIDWCAQKDNAFFQQTRIDVVGPLSPAGLFDYHWY